MRKRGELQAIVAKMWVSSKGKLTPRVLADATNTTLSNAEQAIRRYKSKLNVLKAGAKPKLSIAPGSALGKLMAQERAPEERRFVAAMHMLGIARAEELLSEEKARITREMAGAA